MLRILLCTLGLAAGTVWGAEGTAGKEADYSLYGDRLASRQLLSEILGAPGQKTIRGAKSVWVDVIVQKRADTPAMKTLEEDLRMTALEGQLRKAGFRMLQDGKKSIAPGPKPTVTVMVLHALPRALGDNAKAVYLVLVCAKLDISCMSSDGKPLITWAKVGEPILSDGDDLKDADAIRASAKAGVQAFIDAAKDGE